MFLFTPCDECIHKRKEKKDGWIFTCDAFPNGRPLDFIYTHDYDMPICNDNVGFEKSK